MTNTIADVAEETYQYDGGTISISVKDKDAVGRVVAALNMSVGDAGAYSIIREEGEMITVGRTPPPQAQPVQATPPVANERPPVEEAIPVAPAPVAPAPVEPTPPPPPPVRYPAVVARTNETNPAVRNANQVLNRVSVPDDRLEQHLFGLKSATSQTQMRELQQQLEHYRQYVQNTITTMRRINELSAFAVNDDAVKSVIRQVRQIASGMPDNKIEDAFITESYIVFKTTPIRAFNSRTNKYHNLGRVFLIVPIGTMMGTDAIPIHFQPVDYVYKGSRDSVSMFVPHVSGSGSFCYGNATDAFIEAVVKRDLISLVDIAIRFLENPNMNDGMGQCASAWPELEA